MTRFPIGTLLRLTVALLLIVGPAYWAIQQEAQMRNLKVVKEGVLYRSGQLSLPALKRLIHDFGIRTVVCLRERTRPNSAEEEKYCLKEELNYLLIEPLHWEVDADNHAEVDEGINKFLDVMRDPTNHPVLIHCFAGIHRTGGYCAAYRMEFDHWDNADALAEMKACGYARLDEEPDILGYLQRYRPSWRVPPMNELAIPTSTSSAVRKPHKTS